MTAVRTVHVGVRGRGRWALDLLGADDRFEPVAIVSREPAAVADAARSIGLGPDRVWTSLPAALDAVECDAVVICTPVELHTRDIRIAAAAGKDVLVEKCLSNRWAEAVELVACAEDAGVQLVVAQNYRYGRNDQVLHAAVASGRYGTPLLVDLAVHKYRPAPRQQDYPFAMFWDQGCHHADTLQWIFGPVVEARATTFSAAWSRYRDDAAVQVLLRFESGAVATYLLSNLARIFDHHFLVQSATGALRLGADGWQWHRGAAGDDAAFGWNDPPVDVPVPVNLPRSGEHGVVDTFHRAVTTRGPTELSGRANLETLRVCEMVQRAGTASRPVHRDEIT